MEIDTLNRAINQSSEMSRLGQNQSALKLLDDSIADAIHKNKIGWIRTLSRHAAAIASHIGDVNLVKHYCEQCLTHDPDNPSMLFSLADALQRLGQDNLAKKYAIKSYRLSVKQSTDVDRAIVESLLKTWPDIDTSGTAK
jgi:hypothetical protein